MNSTDSDAGRFHGWITLSIAGLVVFVVMGFMYSFQAFVPIVCDELGWTMGMVGGAASVAYALMGLMAPVAGILTAKYGAKRAIILGNLLVALGFLSLTLAAYAEHWSLFQRRRA